MHVQGIEIRRLIDNVWGKHTHGRNDILNQCTLTKSEFLGITYDA